MLLDRFDIEKVCLMDVKMMKRSFVLWVVVCFVLVGGGVVFGEVIEDDRFKRVVLKEGKDTSYVVGYVNEKTGRTDYIKYLNDVNGKGVKADDNAAVWVVKMFGWDAMLKEMGGYGEEDKAKNRFIIKRIYRKLGMVGFGREGFVCEGWDAMKERLVREGSVVSDAERGKFMKMKNVEWAARKRGNDKDVERVLKMLEGIENEEERREALARLERMKRYVANDKPKGKASDLEIREYFIEQAFDAAEEDFDWEKGAHPLVVDWLGKNDRFWDMFVKGSECGNYYMPLVVGDASGMLFEAGNYELIFVRDGAKGVSLRSRYRRSVGDLKGALADGLSLVRMGRLMQGIPKSSMLMYMVGLRIEQLGYDTLHGLVRDEGFTGAMGLEMIWMISGIKRKDLLGEMIDSVERLRLLDALQAICKGEVGGVGIGGSAFVRKMSKQLMMNVLDVNLMLRVGNEEWDKLYAGLKEGIYYEPKFFERSQKEGKLKVMNLLVSKGLDGRAEVSRLMAEMTCGLMWPAVSSVASRRVKGAMGEAVLGLGFAIEMYKREHGRYPEKLGVLVGKYGLKRLPVDRFSEGDKGVVKYRVMKDGRFKVWSVGDDGDDDGGAMDGDWDERDHVFLMGGYWRRR